MSARITAAGGRRPSLSRSAFVLVLLWLGMLAACGFSPGSHAPFPQNKFSVLQVPAPYVLPGQLIAGPDGTLWFPTIAYSNFTTTKPSGALGRLTPGGQVTLFPLTTPNTYPTAITFTRDGTLWFLASQGNGQLAPLGDVAPAFTKVTPEIGRMTPAGRFGFFVFPSDHIAPTAIAAGPDGNLWVAENDDNGTTTYITRMTPSGVFTNFTLPKLALYDALQQLIVGPDGNLWFSLQSIDSRNNSFNAIGKISPAGKSTLYSLGAYNAPQDMTIGPDQRIWFTSFAKIGRISPSGQVSWFKLNLQLVPTGITTGPDGNLWVATGAAAVGRLTPSGTFTLYPFPSNYSSFDNGSSSLTLGQRKRIATASDGTLWLTDGDLFGHFS